MSDSPTVDGPTVDTDADADAVADASADAHSVVLPPDPAVFAQRGTKTGTPSASRPTDDVVVAAAAALADGPATFVVPLPFRTKGTAGSYGYALREAVADAVELGREWFTSKTRLYEGGHWVALERRKEPTAKRD